MKNMNEACASRRHAQRICATLLALAIALWSMALPLGSLTQRAYADDGYTITISNATNGTYAAYQIFYGSYTESDDGTVALGGDAMLVEAMQASVLSALESTGRTYAVTVTYDDDDGDAISITFYDFENEKSKTVSYTDRALANAVLDALAAIDEANLDATFANYLANAVTANEVSADATATATEASDGTLTATLAVENTGYYLVLNTGSETANSSAILVNVTESGATADSKQADIPQVTKSIVTSSDTGSAITYNGDGTANISYTVTGTVVTDVADYDIYYYAFVDTLPAGFTASLDEGSSNVAWSIACGETSLTSAFFASVSTDSSTSTSTITWACADLTAIDDVSVSSLAGATLTLSYTLTLSSDEVSSLLASADTAVDTLTNSVKVVFSNDPYSSGKGVTGKTDDDPTAETEKTTSTLALYTLVVKKVDSSSDALAGAAFSLKADNGYVVSVGASDSTTSFTFTGLEAGVVYTLTEDTTPSGYKSIEPITFVISTTTASVTVDDADGTVTVPAVDTENSSYSDLSGAVSSWTADTSSDYYTLVATVVNKEGSTLPLTGQQGRMLLMLAGLVLVVGCVLLLTRRRKGNAQQ